MSRGEAAGIRPLQMQAMERGGMRARLATGAADRARVMELRATAWPGDGPDPLDDLSAHLMVEGRDGALLASVRVLLCASGAALAQSYSARFYDLAPMEHLTAPLLEPGRFSLAPAAGWEALRLTWAALARIALAEGAEYLFGCASFAGADWQPHREALALLSEGHIGALGARPVLRAAETLAYPGLAGEVTGRRHALSTLPPMLRFYLSLGGWVSDHAVIDRQLDTLHVFTCVEVAKMPKARKESLRALAMD